jgi:hypothetical protein
MSGPNCLFGRRNCRYRRDALCPATCDRCYQHKGEAKSSTPPDRCMKNAEIAQRTREFSCFARNFANDRDSYRVVKKHGACDAFPTGIFGKTTVGGMRFLSPLPVPRRFEISIRVLRGPDSIAANVNISRASQMPRSRFRSRPVIQLSLSHDGFPKRESQRSVPARRFGYRVMR